MILSRKGFDAKYGGFPSLILNDNVMISLPIPSKNDKMKYSDFHYNNKSYLELILDQENRTKLLSGRKSIAIADANCHLDPDIYKNIIPRHKNWKGAFGQAGIAQRHLKNESVSVGDLFLFFGWFKKPDTKKDVHAIWGYLKVGKIIKSADEIDKDYPWLKDHPHYSYFNDLNNNFDNTIYIAADSLADETPGYGTFKYNEDLTLTADDMSRSKWKIKYNKLLGDKISYHNPQSKKELFFQSASIGQEFVIDQDRKVEEWALGLIRNYRLK